MTIPIALPDDVRDGTGMAGTLFSRLGRNVSWLLGARGVSGLLSVGYLGVASRALGPGVFGTFVLVLAYAGSIAGLAQFKSWQAVVRYGSLHVASARRDRLARLLGLTATADFTTALIGAGVALVGAAVAGGVFGWTGAQTHAAGLFGAVLLLTTGDTASGMLRLSDRFALLSVTETSASLVRLAGAALVWAAGGGLGAMLTVWGLAAATESGLEWLFVTRLPGFQIRFGRRAWRRAVAENPGIWRFMIDSSASSSLAMLWQQAGTLAVGASAGPVAAGGFRVAGKLATALSKPAETATRALYPELAALVASDDPALLRRVAARTTAIGLSLASLLVLVVVAGGPMLLRLVAGHGFAGAQPYLVILAVATAIDLCAIVLEPLLNAHGMSREILIARVVGGVAYVGALAVLLPTIGAMGAAVAAVGGTLVLRLWLAAVARRLLTAGTRAVQDAAT